jgi:hypothetical protein
MLLAARALFLFGGHARQTLPPFNSLQQHTTNSPTTSHTSSLHHPLRSITPIIDDGTARHGIASLQIVPVASDLQLFEARTISR